MAAMATRPAFRFALAGLMAGLAAAPLPAAAQLLPPGTTLEDIRDNITDRLSRLGPAGSGILGLFGYNMIPDGSANALQVSRTTAGGQSDNTLTLGQLGTGFTWAENFPLFTEGYIGYARYDPRSVFSAGEAPRGSVLSWNNVALTLGVGWDIALTENLFLRPIVNGSVGYAASDISLFGNFLAWRTGIDIEALTNRHVNVWGAGGGLVLAYYDYRPERDIEVELRYTQLRIQTFGDTLRVARGRSTAESLTLWTRYRWPTGREAWGRPIRWVLEANASSYLGDQADALGFAWSAKVGGGIEFETARWELGAFGINLNRVRLIGRYFFGDNNVTGYSIGIGMSF
jgi:opacity protein-like surface antigen